jgi:hypothetical protein
MNETTFQINVTNKILISCEWKWTKLSMSFQSSLHGWNVISSKNISHEMKNYIWKELPINIQLSIDGWNGICPLEWMKK